MQPVMVFAVQLNRGLLRFGVFAPLFLCCFGCGGERLYPVEGTIRVADMPLETGMCVLYPDDDRPMPSDKAPSGKIGPGGTYTIMTAGQPGAPPGKYRVAVVAQTQTRPAGVPENPMRIYPLVDQKFMAARTTPLKIVVGPEAKAGDYDLSMTR